MRRDAGSGTSECSAQAAIVAAQKLKTTLQPYLAKGLAWAKACLQASTDGVSLMETGWYKAPTTGNADLYATYGAAVAEVMVDLLTGEVRIERVRADEFCGDQYASHAALRHRVLHPSLAIGTRSVLLAHVCLVDVTRATQVY